MYSATISGRGVVRQAVDRARGEYVIHQGDRRLARLFVDDAENGFESDNLSSREENETYVRT
jgi:hypothetical protein